MMHAPQQYQYQRMQQMQQQWGAYQRQPIPQQRMQMQMQMMPQQPAPQPTPQPAPLCKWYGSAAGCDKGMECESSHDNPNSVKLCSSFMSAGGCKWKGTCWDRHDQFNHPREAMFPSKESRFSFSNNKNPPQQQYPEPNTMPLQQQRVPSSPYPMTPPIATGQFGGGYGQKPAICPPATPFGMRQSVQYHSKELCPKYGSVIGCKWGADCSKSHENPNSVKLCPMINTPEGCSYGDRCYDRHEDFSRSGDGSGNQQTASSSSSSTTDEESEPDDPVMTPFMKIDGGLALYYARCGRNDYVTASGKSKFIEFVEKHGISEDEIGDLLLNVESEEEDEPHLMLRMDDEFPMKKEFDFEGFLESDQQRYVLTVIRRCFVFGEVYGMLGDNRFSHVDWKPFFVDIHNSECTYSAANRGGECAALKRMISAVKYYLNINVTENAVDARQFVMFCNEIYVSFFKDYQHIAEHHCDAKEINFNQCDGTNCLIWYLSKKRPQQYYGNVEYLLSQQNDTGNLLLFRDLMDGMHCALVHKHNLGIRLKFAEWKKGKVDEKEMKKYKDGGYKFIGKIQCRKFIVFVFCTSTCITRGN